MPGRPNVPAHRRSRGLRAKLRVAARSTFPYLRFLLTVGDNLYTVSPTTKSKADVTKGRCECGWKTIRSVRSDVTDNDVTSVPAYG